jgi:hypothetical protein
MKQDNTLYEKFPYLVTWCRMMGSFDYYTQQQLEKANRLKAPYDTIYFDGDNPVRFEDVTSPESLSYFKVRGLKKVSIMDAEDKDWQAFNDNLDWMTEEQATETADKIKAKYK